MTWSLVGHTQIAATSSGTVTTAGVTWSATPDFVAVSVGTYGGGSGGGGGFATVSDSSSNTWSSCTGQNGGNSACQIFYCQGGTFPNGITFTAAGTNVFPIVSVMGFVGSTSSPLDVQSGHSVASGVTSIQPNSGSGITPSQGNSLIIVAADCTDSTSTPYSVNDGFTAPDPGISFSAGAHEGGYAAYLIQATAAQINPTITWTGTSTDDNSAVIAVFKPAAGAAFTWLEMTSLSEPLRLNPEMVGY
jgi:hypothetical protein